MEEPKIPKFVIELTNYLLAIKNLSNIYIQNMQITIQQFLEFINVHKFKNKYDSIESITLNDIRTLKNSDIYSFIFFLAESNYKINSRIVKTEHLRTFFEYLFTIKHTLFSEPFKKINSERRIEKKLPNYLSLEESKKIINLYANSTKPTDIRDRAILHLFLTTGLRLSELKNLKIDDLDMNNKMFSIIGKGNKERTGYLNDITKKALNEYLKIRDKLAGSNNENTLFLNRYGAKLSSNAVEVIVKRAYKKAKINDNVFSVHTLRHTCATLLYRCGINVRTIQELLGHVHIDTTEIYTHLYDKKVMDAMLSHPLGKFMIKDAKSYCA